MVGMGYEAFFRTESKVRHGKPTFVNRCLAGTEGIAGDKADAELQPFDRLHYRQAWGK